LGTSEVLGRKISEAFGAGEVIGGVCHGPLGLLLAKDENGAPLVKGRRLTAVTDKQVKELGITMTPQHPERELRSAWARFESQSAFWDIFANYSVVDGRLVTGQNQNAGAEVANKMMMTAKGGLR
jgi:putative intracellular protease/amidase